MEILKPGEVRQADPNLNDPTDVQQSSTTTIR